MNKQLKELIEQLVRAGEKDHGIKLNIENFDFLINSTAQFVTRNIDKFIAGAAEHDDSDFLLDVDHLTESLKEVYDLHNYLSAAIIKLRKYDERYK